MVIRYQPGRLRRSSDQPAAITHAPLATSGSSHRAGDIPLGTPTCSARSRHGLWALYPSGAEVVVVWPGGALAGPPAEVAQELERLTGSGQGDGHDELDRAAARAIRQFLTDPDARDGTRWLATTRARTWSSPATGYWISGPTNQPGHGHYTPLSWPGAPSSLPRPRVALPDPTRLRRTQPDPSPEPAPQRAA